MGRLKDAWMAADERGWEAIDKRVCSDCVEEPDLWRLAGGEEEEGTCDYCEREEQETLPVSAIQDILYQVINAYYAEPAQAGTPWDEGSCVIEPIYTNEVLGNLGLDPTRELFEDILEADTVGAWVHAAEGHWASVQESQVKLGSWATFVYVVKHHTRYHFQRMTGDHHSQDIEVADMLEVVAEELSTLVRTVEPGTRVFRARHLTDADIRMLRPELMGPPPEEHAASGRMNPAGIPYFYASFDPGTAVKEIGPCPEGKSSLAATFRLTDPLLVVDLTQLPERPSIFAIDLKEDRERIKFLEGFIDSITQPTRKDGQEHIDYVPSQVVSEYLAQAFKTSEGRALDGLIFPSAIHPEGTNLVVFPKGQWFEHDRFPGIEFEGPV